MKKYIIISTYPETGSKNIGDQLITTALIEAIKFVKGSNIIIDVVWREESWEKIKDKIRSSDAIIFACLAIRPNMSTKEYPYLSKLLELDIPMGIISSGTSLPVNYLDKGTYDYVNNETRSLLQELDKKSVFFSTRGYLTQGFCDNIGLNKSKFSGDIAFFNKNNKINPFNINVEIKKIVVSDPHYSIEFMGSFITLIEGLGVVFPNAEIIIALHGNDQLIINYAKENGIQYEEIYKRKDDGLNIYDDADLHVGYRVHAHVSSLKRGMYSYLLEQDGRGCDYGLTINKKLSVPSYRQPKSKLDKVLTKLGFSIDTVSKSPVNQILAMIKQDRNQGFNKFSGLEQQINYFSKSTTDNLNLLP
ncbi:polysaccharide pyruvyl transferase family protein [Vibrio splendidus]|uniref:polysaccharide pyruvyl transferase family protein n=1 Tax=Vibrio splendidus TaxID=29497 RepID=UPI000D3790A1|nr:polysaccharide pyruvyl transferase family protein [Vibrio splendidus]MCC4882881.1 polysaccharide pyruvyl transferase family protein [Vibrio splendidus]PTO57624.1 hypothetical protein CWN96_22795 [Vibrio splendidus]